MFPPDCVSTVNNTNYSVVAAVANLDLSTEPFRSSGFNNLRDQFRQLKQLQLEDNYLGALYHHKVAGQTPEDTSLARVFVFLHLYQDVLLFFSSHRK